MTGVIGRFRRASALSGGVALLVAAALALSFAAPAPAADTVIAPRIVGGVEVDPPDKYPFVAALVRAWQEDEFQGQFCGASLIHPEWVLTAGHCVGSSPASINVLVGRSDLTDDTQGERIGVAEIHRHPRFDSATLANDVALIRLERAATAGSPISLATPADAMLFAPGVVATVVGWGSTYGLPPGTPEQPAKLRELGVPIISDAACTLAWGDLAIFPDMLCAGGVQGQDSCVGDSGGPLFVGGKQVGIVSGGSNPCAQASRPGLYARVATYQEWIASILAATPPPPVLECEGQAATIVGTKGDDALHGTAGDDVIVALAGDDVVYGYAGHDLICLGPGDDRGYGGPGNDVILGQLGADYIEGNGGSDKLIGGAGPDQLIGGAGPDILLGNLGNDELYGRRGNDVLRGGAGDDRLLGGAGDDQLHGGAGYDVLRGGPGFDVCYTGEDVVCDQVVVAPVAG